jgi:hypothetical protein
MIDFPAGTNKNIITTTEHAKLPPDGTRITPMYWPLVPKFTLTGGTGPMFHFANVPYGRSSSPGGLPASNWEIRGLGFIQNLSVANIAGGSDTAPAVGYISVGYSGDSFSQAALTIGQSTEQFTSIVVSGGVATVTHSAISGVDFKTDDKINLRGFRTTTALNGVQTLTGATNTTFTFSTALGDGTYTEPTMYFSYPADATQLASDITINQIISLNNGWSRIVREIGLNGNEQTVKNSWLQQGYMSGQQGQQILAAAGGSGTYIENNSLMAPVAENLFWGGVAQHTPDFPSDIFVRYNYVSHYPLWGRTRRWDLMKTDADVMIFKGRAVLATSAEGSDQYVAIRAGLLGDTEPDFSSCTVVGCTVDEGDLNGTTNPRPVRWKYWDQDSVNIANLLELKGAEDVTIRHNVFEHHWNQTQAQSINIKAAPDSIYPNYSNGCVESMEGTADVSADGLTVTANTGDFPGRMWAVKPVRTVTAVNTSTNLISINSGYGSPKAGMRVGFFGSSLPGGLDTSTLYYARTVTKISDSLTTLLVSTTPDDTGLIDITSEGTGTTMYWQDTTSEVIRIDGVFYQIALFDSATQLTLESAVPTGGSPVTLPFMYGADPVTRLCRSGRTFRLDFSRNWIRNVNSALGIQIGSDQSNTRFVGDLKFYHNFIQQDQAAWASSVGTQNTSSSTPFWMIGPPPDTIIEHNTAIVANTLWGPFIDLGASNVSTSTSNEKTNLGDVVFRNNFITKTSSGSARGYQTTHYAGVLRDYCGGSQGATECPSAQWGKNIFAGAAISSYPNDDENAAQTRATGVYNLGSSNAAFTPDASHYNALFRDYASGKYAVHNTSAFKRTGTDGADYGADMSQIPRILALKVTPTDTLVHFSYALTQPIAHIPCVLEVSERPDFRDETATEDPTDGSYTLGYVGEGSDISTYYGHESDAYDGYVRRGAQRTIIVGQSEPLDPETLHYYRLSCGGDQQTGSFTTLAAQTGTQTISRTTAEDVTWGTSYSRAADTISGGDTEASSGGVASFTANKGDVVYYRYGSGPVRSLAVR